MARRIFDHSPIEPAHTTAIQLHEDLVSLYEVIRDKYQTRIDQAFDGASRQIGFVVTTTVPYAVEVGKGGKIERVTIGAEHLVDTVFDKELSGVLGALLDDPVPIKSVGTIGFYVLWTDALRLKLRADWIEPAHYRRDWIKQAYSFDQWIETDQAAGVREVPSEVHEPAHWFDASVAIALEEKLVISAIDQVYPELRLADRLATAREVSRRWPGTREPAHMRADWISDVDPAKTALIEIAGLLRRHGF